MSSIIFGKEIKQGPNDAQPPVGGPWTTHTQDMTGVPDIPGDLVVTAELGYFGTSYGDGNSNTGIHVITPGTDADGGWV